MKLIITLIGVAKSVRIKYITPRYEWEQLRGGNAVRETPHIDNLYRDVIVERKE